MIDVVVPFRFDGDADRQRALTFVRAWLRAHHSWKAPLVGTVDADALWSKGVAVDRAVRRTKAHVLIIHDADVIVNPDALEAAVGMVCRGAAPWAMPHAHVYRLTQLATSMLASGRLGRVVHHLERRALAQRPHPAPAGGGIVVVHRDAYNAVGGIDPRFFGWGGEDISFARALDTLAGAGWRGDAPMWHLWHVRQARRPGNRGSSENEQLAGRYLDAAGDPAKMAVLAQEARAWKEPLMAVSAS